MARIILLLGYLHILLGTLSVVLHFLAIIWGASMSWLGHGIWSGTIVSDLAAVVIKYMEYYALLVAEDSKIKFG